MSQIVLYFLHITSLLSFYIGVVVPLSIITIINTIKFALPSLFFFYLVTESRTGIRVNVFHVHTLHSDVLAGLTSYILYATKWIRGDIKEIFVDDIHWFTRVAISMLCKYFYLLPKVCLSGSLAVCYFICTFPMALSGCIMIVLFKSKNLWGFF